MKMSLIAVGSKWVTVGNILSCYYYPTEALVQTQSSKNTSQHALLQVYT